MAHKLWIKREEKYLFLIYINELVKNSETNPANRILGALFLVGVSPPELVANNVK